MKQRPLELDPATCEWQSGYEAALADAEKLLGIVFDSSSTPREFDRIALALDFLREEAE